MDATSAGQSCASCKYSANGPNKFHDACTHCAGYSNWTQPDTGFGVSCERCAYGELTPEHITKPVCAECNAWSNFVLKLEFLPRTSPPPVTGRLTSKDSNPKDAVGVGKVPFSTVPASVMAEIGLAMLEGARKYGRHNYRVAGVLASVYYDGTMRHLTDWWEGVDVDPDSDLSHVTKAIASLVVLRDAMLNDMWKDDRPPRSKRGWIARANKKAKEIIKKYPNAVEPYTEQQLALTFKKET